MFLNALIIGLVFIGHHLSTAAGAITALLIVALCFKAFVQPVRTFFLLIGVKLTFDGLWFLDLPFPSEASKPLVLFLAPVLIVVLTGPRLPSGKHKRITLWAVLYLSWVVLAQVLNSQGLDVEVTTRQAFMLIGLMLGFKYVRSQESLDLLCLLVVVSAVLPVLLGVFQGVVHWDFGIFHGKLSTRGFRPSGIYYDPGTSGTVYLMALACGMYLLCMPGISERHKKYLVFIVLGCVACIIVGSTLSMFAAMCCGFLILGPRFVPRLRSPAFMCMLFAAVCIMPLLWSQTTSMFVIRDKTAVELERLQEGMQEGDVFGNPQLFTGRMAIWQNAWARFEDASLVQKLLGKGQGWGLHSTYFHLLLQIGVLGVVFYIVFHVWILFELTRVCSFNLGRTIATLSILWIFFIGFSLATVIFTSFQWFAYILVASVLNQQYASTASTVCQQERLCINAVLWTSCKSVDAVNRY